MNLCENPGIYSCAILIPLKLVYRCTFEAFCRFKRIKITDRILSVVNARGPASHIQWKSYKP